MKKQNKRITLQRDCSATLIPSGDRIVLQKGQKVEITQALGGSFTLYINGNLVKLSGKNADAIGEKVIENNISKTAPETENILDKQLIWDRLKMCYDPEIPVNIVDLGLIYDIKITPHHEDGHIVIVTMTLTAPGCGMGPSIARDVEFKVSTVPGVKEVKVELVWEPLWNRDLMSDTAKLQLGML